MPSTSSVDDVDCDQLASRTADVPVNHTVLASRRAAGDHRSTSGQSGATADPFFSKAEVFEYEDEGGRKRRRAARMGSYSRHSNGWVVTILCLLILAMAVILAHHFVYRHLDGQTTSVLSQAWTSHIGVGFPFLVKALLGACMTLVYLQVFWYTVSRRFYSISNLDGLFTLLDNPLQFFNIHLIGRTTLALLVALLAWTLPIALLFTPGAISLTSGTGTVYGSSEDVTVPTFPREDVTGSIYSIDSVGYIRTPFVPITRATDLAFYSGQSLLATSFPCSSDCTFRTSFFGPGLSCTTYAEDANKTAILTAPEVASWLQGYRIENFLYFGQGVFDNTTNTTFVGFGWETPASYRNDSNLMDVIRCVVYNASYDLDFTSTSSSVSMIPTTMLLHPIEFDFTLPSFQTEQTRAGSPPPALLAPYEDDVSAFLVVYSTVRAFLSFVQGNIVPGSTGPGSNQTSMLFAAFTEGNGLMPFDTSSEGIETFQAMMANLTISLLTLSNDNQTVTATSVTQELVYHYDAKGLWIPYGIAFGLCSLFVTVGIWALGRNGQPHSNAFSELLSATRNPSLDAQIADRDSLRNFNVRYGVLRSNGRAGFGLPGEVDPLTR